MSECHHRVGSPCRARIARTCNFAEVACSFTRYAHIAYAGAVHLHCKFGAFFGAAAECNVDNKIHAGNFGKREGVLLGTPLGKIVIVEHYVTIVAQGYGILFIEFVIGVGDICR